jgi:hypothetical protein
MNYCIFVNVKIGIYISLIAAIFLLTACPNRQPRQSALKQLQDNKMDFPDLRSRRYSTINYQLSRLFDYDYSPSYTIQDNATAYVIYDLDVHFSVERFELDEAEMIQYAFDGETTTLDAVHDNYILRRKSSLDNAELGIKKALPKSIQFPGYIQIIEGERKYYDSILTYMTATIEVGNNFYVFQLIGKEENMGYLYDDFIDILSSVHV